MQKNLCVIFVSTVRSPSVFYVQVKEKQSEFETMMAEIAEVIKDDPLILIDEKLQPGTFALAQVLVGKCGNSQWARVVVKSCNLSMKSAKVSRM